MKIKDPLDRLKQLEEEMGALKGTVSELRNQVVTLREALKTSRHPVEAFLWQRGFPVIAQGDRSWTLLPSDISLKANEHFYQLMRRYSFRLFLRDLIQFPEGKDFKVLNRYCSMRTVRSYLENLAQLGIVTLGRDRSYHLILQQVSSFGPTLEWYVSEIFQREFMAPALFNVRLQHTRYGGDYDVIALIGGRLVYVEVKSSPPRGVELQAVSAFLNRLQDLQPRVAVFLVDTELRMKDKIVPLFAQALGATDEHTESSLVSRLINEIFHIHHSIYLINSRKGIYSNLRYCFRDSFQAEKKAVRLIPS
jgi:hypothetical protein